MASPDIWGPTKVRTALLARKSQTWQFLSHPPLTKMLVSPGMNFRHWILLLWPAEIHSTPLN